MRDRFVGPVQFTKQLASVQRATVRFSIQRSRVRRRTSGSADHETRQQGTTESLLEQRHSFSTLPISASVWTWPVPRLVPQLIGLLEFEHPEMGNPGDRPGHSSLDSGRAFGCIRGPVTIGTSYGARLTVFSEQARLVLRPALVPEVPAPALPASRSRCQIAATGRRP